MIGFLWLNAGLLSVVSVMHNIDGKSLEAAITGVGTMLAVVLIEILRAIREDK